MLMGFSDGSNGLGDVSANRDHARSQIRKGKPPLSYLLRRWWLLGLLVVIVLSAVISMIPTWMGMRGPLYESRALIEVKSISRFDALLGIDHQSAERIDFAKYIPSEIDVMRSEAVVGRALKNGDVIGRLGHTPESAVTDFRNLTVLTQRRGTDLVEVVCRHEDPQTSTLMVKSMYEAYEQHRSESIQSIVKENLHCLESELQGHEHRVKELRERLMAEAYGSGSHWIETEAMNADQFAKLRPLEKAEKQLYQTERDLEQLSFRLSKLDDLSGVGYLRAFAEVAGVTYRKEFSRYEILQKELKGIHEIEDGRDARLQELNGLRLSLESSANKEYEKMKARLGQLKQDAVRLEREVDRLRQEGASESYDAQKFNKLRQEYQKALAVKDDFLLDYQRAQLALTIPPSSMIVHKLPEVSDAPVTRGAGFYGVLLPVLFLPVSVWIAYGVILLADRMFPLSEGG